MIKSILKKSLSAGMIFLICPVVLFGCKSIGQYNKSGEYDTSSVKKQKVTLITKSTNSAFWKSVYSGASAASTEYNMELIFEGPENEEDYEAQNKMIEKAVEEGSKAIVFSAIDYEANAEAITKAANEGVKVIVIDSDVNSDQVSCRIGTDNYEAGCTAGEAALSFREKELNIGIVNFDKTTENGQSREKGFRETVKKDSRAFITASINVQSSASVVEGETKQMLKDNPQINVLVTFNEFTSLGVGAAIKELGMQDRIRVVAFDSNVVCVDMLETGELDSLIVQNPYAIGYLGIERAYNLLNGYGEEIKEIDTAVKLVTKENMYSDECQRILFAFSQE